MVILPVVANVPLQPPEAVQLAAFEALHCSVTDAPIATLLSLAFRVTAGGATTAGVSAPVDGCALEPEPHAVSEPRAANPSIDFNSNASLELRLRRIELIRISQDSLRQLFFAASIPFTRNL